MNIYKVRKTVVESVRRGRNERTKWHRCMFMSSPLATFV